VEWGKRCTWMSSQKTGHTWRVPGWVWVCWCGSKSNGWEVRANRDTDTKSAGVTEQEMGEGDGCYVHALPLCFDWSSGATRLFVRPLGGWSRRDMTRTQTPSRLWSCTIHSSLLRWGGGGGELGDDTSPGNDFTVHTVQRHQRPFSVTLTLSSRTSDARRSHR
jgi:hypothetical protein